MSEENSKDMAAENSTLDESVGLSDNKENLSEQSSEGVSEEKDCFDQASTLLSTVKQEIQQVLIGQERVVEQVLVSLVARGHVLIEGVPGLGKTLLVRCLAKCFGGEFSRVQFTPDLMPSDVTGHAMFNMNTQSFEVRKGPAFTHLLLADEINRAPAKTQASLLEVMQERQITIEGTSYPTLSPFMVLATQNPVEQDGTYPLPEAELDRFALKVHIDYPEEQDELNILRAMGDAKASSGFNLERVRTLLKPGHVLSLQKIAEKITVDEQVLQYITSLVRSTRNWPGLARGAGPRASIAVLACSRALALLNGTKFVTPDDVRDVFLPALRHRILLAAEAEIEGTSSDEILSDILNNTEAPRR